MKKHLVFVLATLAGCPAPDDVTMQTTALTAAGLPAPPSIPADNALLQKGFLDATLYPGVDSTGVTDSRAGLQAALDDGYKYAIPVYLPPGTYLVTGPLIEAQLLKSNYDQYSIAFTPQGGVMQHAVLVGGVTPARPTLVLADHAAGFGNASSPQAVLDIHAKDAAGTMTEEQIAPSGMGLIVRNLEIDLGTGNPGAVGLQLPSAQFSQIEDLKVDATGGYAGLRWVVSVNTMVNIEVTGGQYGVITDTCCGVNIAGLTLRDQTKAGLLVQNSTTTVVEGFDISETTATPIMMNMIPVRGELSLHDGKISSPGTVIANQASRTLYMQNVYVNTAGPLVVNGSDAPIMVPADWQNVGAYVFTEAPGKVTRNDLTTFTASTTALIDGVLAPVTGLTLGSAGAPPDGFATLHSWARLPWFDDADAHDAHDLGVKGDGVSDDTAALQAAIDAHDEVFLPRGDYVLNKPLVLHAHTKLFGPPGLGTRLCPTWNPNATLTHAVTTDNDPAGDTYLGNVVIRLRGGFDNSYMGGLDWRVGRKSLVNELTIYMPYEDPNAPGARTSAARSLIGISGGGGGRWYGATPGDPIWRSANPGSRSVLIQGTTEPLSFYGANLEHNRGDYSVEIADAANIRVYSSKTENNTPFIYCHGSHNLLLTGVINRDSQVLESDDCDGVLAPNIQDFSWELGGPVIVEKFGGHTVTFPLLTEASVFQRGTYDPSAFTGIGGTCGDGTCSTDETCGSCPSDCTCGMGATTACGAASAPTLDGDASDWAGIARTPITAMVEGASSGDADVSAVFATQWDATTLYVLVEVTDDTVITDGSTTLLQDNDSVELYLDGMHTASVSYDSNDFQLTTDASGRLGGTNAAAASYTSAAARTAIGYTVEYAIPLASIGASSGATVGFDIAVNDNDDSDQTRDAQLFWRGSAASWNNPSTWGSLALGATPCSDAGGETMATGGCCSTGGGGLGGTASLVAVVMFGLRRRRRFV